MGAATGAISGACFYGAGQIINQMNAAAFEAVMGATDVVYGAAYTVSSATQAAVHAGAGALSGGINAGITGGDIGMGALIGGISGGVAKGLGNLFPSELTGNGYADYALGLSRQAAIGGITGGIVATMYGGDFGEGAFQGAWTAGFGYTFNAWGEEIVRYVNGKIASLAKIYNSKQEAGIEIPIVDFNKINKIQLALGAYQTLEGTSAIATSVSFPLGMLTVPGGGAVAASCIALTVSPGMAYYGYIELSHGLPNLNNAVKPAISTYRIDFKH
jgi:hypothetical protein